MESVKDIKGEEMSLHFKMPKDKTLYITITDNNRYYLKCGDKTCSAFTTDEGTAYKMAQAAQWAAYNIA